MMILVDCWLQFFVSSIQASCLYCGSDVSRTHLLNFSLYSLELYILLYIVAYWHPLLHPLTSTDCILFPPTVCIHSIPLLPKNSLRLLYNNYPITETPHGHNIYVIHHQIRSQRVRHRCHISPLIQVHYTNSIRQ